MNQCCEYIRGLRQMLHMLGISVEGPAHILVDNTYILVNSSHPTSVLEKKLNLIAYHLVREGTVADE